MKKAIILLLLFCVTPLYSLTKQDVKKYIHKNKKTIIITSIVLGVTTYFILKYSTERILFRKKHLPFMNTAIDPGLLPQEGSEEDDQYGSEMFQDETGD